MRRDAQARERIRRVMTAAELIRMSRQENRTVAEYPETQAEQESLLEDLGAECSDDCCTQELQSGSGYSGPEARGHYDVWGDDWRVHVIAAPDVAP